MRFMLLLPTVTFVLVGCGGSSTPKKTTKKDEPKPTVPGDPISVSNTPPQRTPPPPPQPPRATGFEKTNTPPPPPSQPRPATTTTVKAGGDEFGPDLMSGRTVGKWVAMIEGGKKDDIIEALEVFKLGRAHPGAKKALPKINELMTHNDPEIAKLATEVSAAIGK